MGGGKGSTTTRADIPPELRPLYQEGGQNILRMQRTMPLRQFSAPGGGGTAFQTAGRVPQFGYAQNRIPQAEAIANQQLSSRAGLNRQPGSTTRGLQVAQQARQSSTQVPVQFDRTIDTARRQTGLQGLEQAAINRAGHVQNRIGQTPGTFGQAQQEFRQGVEPLQRYTSQAPGTFGEVRAQADPRLAELNQMADRRITGEELMDSRSYQAAQNAFQAAILPQIQNQAALSGLGRSTGLTQSMAAAQAQYLLPVIQEELAREERALERGLGARQFGTQFAADLGLQEAMAQERGIERATGVGQFGLATSADLGLQEALAQERGIERVGQAGQFAAGLEAQTGQNLAARREAQIQRETEAQLQRALAGERGIERGQAASQFLSGQYQAAGQQDLQRSLEGLYADERSRALQYQGTQDAIGQLMAIGQSHQDYAQGALDRRTQDYLRRQSLAETALFQPFGQVAPSSIGQRASSSKK